MSGWELEEACTDDKFIERMQRLAGLPAQDREIM